MSNLSIERNNKEITAEACLWVAQLESGKLSSADIVALREWMGRSDLHAKELREIATLSGQLNVLTEMAPAMAKAASLENGLRARRRVVFAKTGAVAVVLLLAFASVMTTLLPNWSERPVSVTYHTAVGEYSMIDLSDGSSIKLNTDSFVEVYYSSEIRQVRLVRGEVLFDVASEPNRPFVVYSDDAVVRAVGTSFVVRLRKAVTEIAVIEGVVAFSELRDGASRELMKSKGAGVAKSIEESASPEAVILVRAGETAQTLVSSQPVALADKPISAQISPRDMQRKLSWTEGLFDFSQTPLEDVIFEVGHHNTIEIIISDPELRELKFSGIFRTGDVDSLLEALEGLGVQVEKVSADRIELFKADDS